ncbi:hypothetical protein GCM10007389_36190 [Pontibacter akesuensis]|nr:hypothetical protein GCM10007389_36190 [Pontibacter akesuensis]
MPEFCIIEFDVSLADIIKTIQHSVTQSFSYSKLKPHGRTEGKNTAGGG